SSGGRMKFTRVVATMIAAGMSLALAGAPAPAQAQGGVEAKVQVCNVCHGANGVPLDAKTMPVIWGQTEYYIVKQLANYRNGMREPPTMPPLAKGLGAADLRPIAAYFAGKQWPVTPAPAASAAPPAAIATCLPCHQPKLEGGAPAPRLAGLNYD